MRSKLYTFEKEIFPFQGLDTYNPPEQLANGYSPSLLNVQVTKGQLSKRKGYGLVGDGSVDMNDPVIGIVEFEDITETKHLVAVTTKKQFVFNTATQQWDNITQQTAVVDDDWTGDLTNPLDYAIVRGTDSAGDGVKWLIITNGKDNPRYWDGTGLFLDYLDECDYPDLVTFGTLEYNTGHLILGNITLGATGEDTQLIIWSEAGSLTKFTTGTSGAYILSDSVGAIQKLMNLSDRCIVYSEDSICMLTYTGGLLIYSAEQIANQTRLVSSRSIVNVGPYHLYMSAENIYLFDGNRVSRPIGDIVQTQYREELFVNRRHEAFAFLDRAKNQVYFHIPITETESRIYVLEYDMIDLSNMKWSIHAYSHAVYSMGFFSKDTELTWAAASLDDVSWDGADFTWNQGSIREGFPARVFGSTGVAYLHDDTSSNDAGVAYTAFWDTKDVVVPQQMQSLYGRFMELEIVAQGFEIRVHVSKDQGVSYQFVKRLNLTGDFTIYKIPIDFTSRTLRVRLENVCLNSTFFVRQVKLHMRAGGAH
jgi:hypothetical protein